MEDTHRLKLRDEIESLERFSTAKQKVEYIAEKYGITIKKQNRGEHFQIILEAPEGWHFQGTNRHIILEARFDKDKPTSMLWRDILAVLKYGMAICCDEYVCDCWMFDSQKCDWWGGVKPKNIKK